MKRTLVLALIGFLLLDLPALAVSAKRTVELSCGAGAAHDRTGAVRRGPTAYGRRAIYPPPSVPCQHVFEFSMEVDPHGSPAGLSRGPGGRPLILLHPGTRYSVTLHNPLPVQVAVNLTVDGLNTLTGEPGTPSSGAKWLIPPYSRIVVSGWQTGERTARAFVVTSRQASYARWRSDAWARDLSVNCGVIGAAYFWNRSELESALAHTHPPPFARGKAQAMSRRAPGAGADRPAFDAGTGMGERIANPVRSVYFSYDDGMYDPDDAVVVFYDFPDRRVVRPQPLGTLTPPIDRERPRYAPEMPSPYERR